MPSVVGERDRYELLAPLARGRAGPVVRATDPTGRALVVKFHERADSARLEAARLRSIDHPGVVRLIDHGIDDEGRHWLAFPEVPGQTMAELIRNDAPLEMERVHRIVDGLAAAVEELHRVGVVHCDLSPDNVMIADDDTVTVLDLGVSTLVMADNGDPAELPSTRTIDVEATPRYTAPEVAAGRAPTAASDRYALALLTYELATGAFPYPDVAAPIAMLGHHATTEPLPASDHRPDLPAGFDAALRRGLSKTPSDRPASATAFARSLRLAEPAGDGRSPRGSVRGRALAATVVAATAVVALFVFRSDSEPDSARPGDAAALTCNFVQDPGFDGDTVPVHYYGGDPTNTVSRAPGDGLESTPGLRLGDDDRFGLFGETIPIRPGVEYEFSVWARLVDAPETTAIYIDWLDADFRELTRERNAVEAGDSIGSVGGARVTVRRTAPDDAAYGVPTVFKNGSPGAVVIDELVFGEAARCPDLAG